MAALAHRMAAMRATGAMPWCAATGTSRTPRTTSRTGRATSTSRGSCRANGSGSPTCSRPDGSTWCECCIPMWRARTPGGHGAAGHSTTMRAGASTTSWRRGPGGAGRRCAGREGRGLRPALVGPRSRHRRVPLSPVRAATEMAQYAVEVVGARRLDGRSEWRPVGGAEVAVGHGKCQRQRGGDDLGGQLVGDTQRRGDVPPVHRRNPRSGTPSPSRQGTPRHRRTRAVRTAHRPSRRPRTRRARRAPPRSRRDRDRPSPRRRTDSTRQVAMSAPKPLAAAANPRCWTVMWARRSRRFQPSQGVGRTRSASRTVLTTSIDCSTAMRWSGRSSVILVGIYLR